MEFVCANISEFGMAVMPLLLLSVRIRLSFFDINCTLSSESMASSYFIYKGRLKHLPMLPSPISLARRKKKSTLFDAIFKANYFLWAATPLNKVAYFPSFIFILTSPNPCFFKLIFCRFSIFYWLQSDQENINTYEVGTSCEYPFNRWANFEHPEY
jgi:hypothetical protein